MNVIYMKKNIQNALMGIISRYVVHSVTFVLSLGCSTIYQKGKYIKYFKKLL